MLGGYGKGLLIRCFVGSFMNCCKREHLHLQKQWHNDNLSFVSTVFHKDSVLTNRKHCLSVTKTNQLIPSREVMASDSELNM